MKRLPTFLFLLILAFSAQAQEMATWNVYPAYTIATKSIPAGTQVFALMESKLLAYDMETESKTLFDWKTHLNGITISRIDYSAEAKRLIVVYEDGNIDLISTQDLDEIVNLSQVKNDSRHSTINNLSVSGSRAYLSTGAGIVVIDMSKGVVENTFDLDVKCVACAVVADAVYASTSKGILRGARSTNLLDKANWKIVNETLKNCAIFWFDDHLWVRAGAWTMLYKSNGEGLTGDGAFEFTPTFVHPQSDCLILGNATATRIYTACKTYEEYKGNFSWNDLARKGSTFWAADGQKGLQSYTLDKEGQFQLKTTNINANSPLHDYSLHFKLIDKNLYVVGGNWNYSTVSRPGTVMKLTPEGTWMNFDCQATSDTATAHNDKFIDATDIVQDPNDATHHYVGTARNGIYQFRNGKYAGHITCTNSPLRSILPENTRPQNFVVADALHFDNLGNLWVLNCTQDDADTSICVRKPNGEWTKLFYSEIAEATTIDRIFFDSKNRIWMNSRRMAQRGLFFLDWNGTLSTSDDKHTLRSTITNQKEVAYNPDEFYCIAEDRDGYIWVGTNLGPFAVTDPDNYTSSTFRFEQIIVDRNDGSGLADYLLSGIPISAIAIDGANRKWFGSLGNGVYLMSADCQTQLQHFTASNSSLASDNIYDILVNPQTGEVFFATDKGICSYVSDATEPAEQLDEDAVYAYPNPVEPDFNGLITVRGLTADGEVKICSSTGQLVWQGTSTGGTFTWNGCNRQGRRVASGIYHVIANDAAGETAVVTRIAFMK